MLLNIGTHAIRLHQILCRLMLNHGLNQVDLEELLEDDVAVLAILKAETSVAISPQGLIPNKRVIDRYVLLSQSLHTDTVDGSWQPDRLKHVFLQHNL